MVMSKYGLMSGVALAALLTTPAVMAQEITSTARGVVYDPSGAPASGVSVTIVDTRTGTTRSVTTGANGAFNFRNMKVGGPYTISATLGTQNAQVTEVVLNVGSVAVIDLALQANAIEEITVTAAPSNVAQLAIGPSSSFSFTQIQAQPSISRQIRDVIRIDPRVNIGRANGGNGLGISCLGSNNRLNAQTIDGIRAADGFGLNSSGNLARNTFPIPFDSVGDVSVEFAPVDVTYGQFSGCQINMTTKSGTNEFSGSAFFTYAGDSLTGDQIDGQTFDSDFDNYQWGAELGGPIVEDKLFFYVSYEEFDFGRPQNSGPIGAGFPVEEDITLDQANQVRDVLINQYGRDPGTIIRSLSETNRRFFGRIDWNISDQHRLAATYARLEESNIEDDDLGGGTFTFSDNFENEGTRSDSFSIRLFSDWTENFSTELRYSRQENTDLQNPLGGGEAQEENITRISLEVGGDEVFVSGPGFFRSANALEYQVDQIRAKGDYVMGDHQITFGYELDRLNVFNLFAPNATGTITFQGDTFAETLANLQSGQAGLIEGTGSFSGDIRDAAATFSRNIHTLYVQDEWSVTDALTITAGVRYDWYQSDDAPAESAAFVERYGFSNSVGFNNLDAFQPRVGFTWALPEETFGQTTIQGGIAIFSGGEPTVWYSNAFSNFGSGLGDGELAADDLNAPCTAADLNVLTGGFNGLPACITAQQQAEAQSGQGRTDAISPDFKLPTVTNFNFGIAHTTDFGGGGGFFDDWNIRVDFSLRDFANATDFVDLTLTEVGRAPDGRPRFNAIDPLLDGCNATFIAPRVGFDAAGADAACDAGGDDQDILLVNDEDGSGYTFNTTVQLQKRFDFNDWSSLDLNIGYAYTDAQIGNSSNSSTATSSFEETAIAILNRPAIAPSQFNNEHNITVNMNFRAEFIEDHATNFTVFYRARSGRPFSYVYDNPTGVFAFGDSDFEERVLLYVPTGPDDQRVDFSALGAQGTADFFEFLDETGLSDYAGQVAPRNEFEGPWNHDIDLRLSQEIPGFFGGDRFEVWIAMENFLNFLGDDLGVQRFPNRGDVGEGVPVIQASIADNGQYVYSNFDPGGSRSNGNFLNADRRSIDQFDTLWRLQLGVRYSF